MSLIQGIDCLSSARRPSVVSIGNFDGVHKGHQHIVQTLLGEAREHALASTIVTFEPLAREFFAPNSIARLTTLAERSKILFELGVDQVLCIEFNEMFSQFSPERFIQEVLLDGLDTQFLSVGDDFRFGHQRAGDFATLQAAGQRYDFKVVRHDTILHNGERVSSGRVRAALAAADLALAQDLLGRPYSINGVVSVGQKLGRTLGFPTANIVLGDRCVPVAGVYAVRVELATQGYNGVANVGMRPTIEGKEQRLEVHLFDFSQNLYGQSLSVEFVHKIRDERKFASLTELTTQIDLDAQAARQLLQA